MIALAIANLKKLGKHSWLLLTQHMGFHHCLGALEPLFRSVPEITQSLDKGWSWNKGESTTRSFSLLSNEPPTKAHSPPSPLTQQSIMELIQALLLAVFGFIGYYLFIVVKVRPGSTSALQPLPTP